MSDTKEAVSAKIRAYIAEEYFAGHEGDLTDDIRLITDGFIDSVAVMVLVDFLENTFGIEFEPYEVDADNLDSINLMSGFVLGKMN